MYIGRKELQFTEQEFWSCTPCKFFALLQCALDYNRARNGEAPQQTQRVAKQASKDEGFIDKIPGW